MENKNLVIERTIGNLTEIYEKEPEVVIAISMVVEHIHGTYSDKYAKGQTMGIDTKCMLYDKDKGKAINEYQIARYLQRYVTEGTKKSGLLKDLLKAVHYSVFEIVRRIKAKQLDMNEPAV